MAKLTNTDKELILADFHTGQFTIRTLADKYKVSHPTIVKITRGLEPKHRDKVTALITIQSDLAKESYQEVTSVKEVVTKALERQALVFSVTEKALHKAHRLLDEADNINDCKIATELADRASITLRVNERHAPKSDTNVAVQANIQNNTLLMSHLQGIDA